MKIIKKIYESVYYNHNTGEFVRDEVNEKPPIPEPVYIQNPEIIFFITDKNLVVDDTPVTLQWEVRFANYISIEGKRVPASGSMTFHCREPKEVTLKAMNNVKVTVERMIRIEVDSRAPVILYFKADKLFTVIDYPVNLSWEVSGAVSLSINNGVGDVSDRQSLLVKPKKDSNYSLTATSYFGVKAIADVPIVVFPMPIVESIEIPVPRFINEDISFTMPAFILESNIQAGIEVNSPSFTDLIAFTKLDTVPATILFSHRGINSLLFANDVFRMLIKKQKEITHIIQSIWKKKLKAALKRSANLG